MALSRRRPLPDPSPLKAGDRARNQLLEAAGEVFAERGYGQATSKEICERAGMNAAAVNYHFGGFEQLYAETLAYAEERLVAIEALRDIAASDAPPRQKLKAFIALFVRRLALPRASWEMRLVGREIVSPSPVREVFLKSQILPRAAVLRGIIAAFLGTAPDDPVVGRSMLAVVGPALMLAIAHRDMLTHVIPGLVNASDEIDPLIEHFERFTYAGLEAIAAQLAAKRSRQADPLSTKVKARRQTKRKAKP